MRYKVTLTLTEELLGTASANPEIYEEFIKSKRPDTGAKDDETDTLPPVEDELQKATTVFHRGADGVPFLYDYTIKGFFKDACGVLKRAGDAYASGDLKAYKKEIDGLIFVGPRQIPAVLPPGGAMGICQRPLRAQTAQGERISLARSETLPAGTVFSFEITILRDGLSKLLTEWLDYGQLRGLGQWRNSGKGRFVYTMELVK